MNIPDHLPILSRYKQAPGSGQVCAEQAISWLVSGRLDLDDETDHPQCVQPVLNALAIVVNDQLPDDRRGEMWPIILRQVGTARPDMEPVLSVQLGCWLADAVSDLRRPKDQAVLSTAVAAARGEKYANATYAAMSAVFADADACANATYNAVAAYVAAYAAAFALANASVHVPANVPANAFAYANAAPTRLLALLSGAQAEHERLTGHRPEEVPVDRLARLGELVGTLGAAT